MDIALDRASLPPSVVTSWQGLDARAGGRISGLDHLEQSLRDILTTRPGERIMRPEYGCDLLDLVDRPLDGEWFARFYARVARAIARWEPRVRLERVRAVIDTPGRVTVDLTWRLRGSTVSKTQRASVLISAAPLG